MTSSERSKLEHWRSVSGTGADEILLWFIEDKRRDNRSPFLVSTENSHHLIV
jgi:hypothetical protein